MGKIVMIGGVTPPANLDLLDKEIINLTGKKQPKLVYIPAAGGDDLNYCELNKKVYGERFGCSFDILFLIRETPCEEEIREKIFSADIVYVEGGSSLRLMECIKKYNLNNILKEAYEKGIVLAGKSAGAICFSACYLENEEAEDFLKENYKDYDIVECLNLMNFIVCPHYNMLGRKEKLEAMVKKFMLSGIGIDNDCAVEFVDGSYRVIGTNEISKAYMVYYDKGKLCIREIIREAGFRSIKELDV